ncbi:unnamed protein product [Soboliphyme baturini]|uniref:Uncharacterized protein n=1 Tax=Soboliphyme baturini TaxID=241478 RepID=A0A183IB13_9BILA|nr:unnamed protein product [Soboliphyme baturini]
MRPSQLFRTGNYMRAKATVKDLCRNGPCHHLAKSVRTKTGTGIAASFAINRCCSFRRSHTTTGALDYWTTQRRAGVLGRMSLCARSTEDTVKNEGQQKEAQRPPQPQRRQPPQHLAVWNFSCSFPQLQRNEAATFPNGTAFSARFFVS